MIEQEEDFVNLYETVSWCRAQFPLLNLDAFFSSASTFCVENAESETTRQIGTILNSTEFVEATASSTLNEYIRRARSAQFQNLIELAKGEDSAISHLAQSSLYLVSTDDLIILGNEQAGIEFRHMQIETTVRNKDFQVLAAECLASIIQTGSSPNSILARYVCSGLYKSNCGRARIEFLKGIHKLTAYKDAEDISSYRSSILHKAVNLETGRKPEEQDYEFQGALIDSLVYFKAELSVPLLKALAMGSHSDKIRAQATEMISMIERTLQSIPTDKE